MLVESLGLSYHQCHGVKRKTKTKTKTLNRVVLLGTTSSTWPEFLYFNKLIVTV